MLLPNTKFITPVLFDTGILILYFKTLLTVLLKKFVIFSEKILVEVKKIIITDIALN